MNHKLSIVQYNCGQANAKATRALFDSFEEPLILAIQEPGYNNRTKSTYCPKPYQLAYEALPEIRTCFMIRRDVPASQWKRRQYGPNVATLTIVLQERTLTIVNVYNPRSNDPRIKEWPRIQEALQGAQGDILLLGDFNTHHPTWGGQGVACEQQAERLLFETKKADLYLLTQQGDPTWKRGRQATVIDLTFASYALSQRVEYCGTEPEWALTKDHIPIRIALDVGAAVNTQAGSKRYALQKLDTEGLSRAVKGSGWENGLNPLETLQETLERLLPQFCPKARPSPRARPDWSPKATELLAGARRARRRLNVSHDEEDRRQHKNLSNQLKHEMRRNARANWRRLIEDLTNNSPSNGKGLWKLSRWSRRVAGKPHADPHIPALRRHEGETPTDDDNERTRILAEKFFPQPPQVELDDTIGETQATRTLQIKPTVTTEELQGILRWLPNNKAPGPDGIPNEVLKALEPTIDQGLAHAMSTALAGGSLPYRYKESTTIVLRKEGKKDYSLPSSYRPIALENTLAKVIEKALANRIADAAEKEGLIPWNQMGARRNRSTLSAVGLLTTCVETAWRARPGCVVSMLSLDLAGAFDNVPHEILLATLRKKGFPEWLTKAIASFLQGRRTRIAYTGHESDWIETKAGIPQGSPLSPILFLFYIAGLLEEFQDPRKNTLGFGFVDDTNLITWGESAEDNCRRLSAAHERCEAWAKRHGAKFAPDKYQLIHFTRSRQHACDDLATSVQIGGHRIEAERKAIRVLGVWLDPKLTWKEHIAQATRKGLAASEAAARLAAATWGPSVRNTRLLYTAVIRPAILYGAQEWSKREAGEKLPKARISPLEKVQNICLRRITGGYRRTPRAALEKEAHVMPLDLYVDARTNQSILRTQDHPVETSIRNAAEAVWTRMRRARNQRSRKRRPDTAREATLKRAKTQAREAGEKLGGAQTRTRQARDPHDERGEGQPTLEEGALVVKGALLDWKARWEDQAKHKGARGPATWTAPWEQDRIKLYAGLTKAEATALFLMRTEVIGLNAWLASIRVPGILPACECGWRAQTVRHVVLHCPRYERLELLEHCGTERLDEMLSQPASAKHAARWLVRSGAMKQFRVAREIEREEQELFKSFEKSEAW